MHPSNKRLVALFRACSTEQLEPLCKLLDAWFEGKPSTPEEIADYLRRWGSSTIMTIFRGWKGADYIEVTRDVAKALNADLPKKGDERDYELAILGKVVEKYLQGASPEDREQIEKILKEAGDEAWKSLSAWASGAGKPIVITLLNTVGRQVTQQILKRIILWIVAKQTAKQAAKAAARLAGMAIPLLNIVFAVWLLIDLAGPAYRKTVPAVIQVALLRLAVEP